MDMVDSIKTCKLCGSDMKRIHFVYSDTYNLYKCKTYITDDNQPYRNLGYYDIELYGCPECGMVIMSV